MRRIFSSSKISPFSSKTNTPTPLTDLTPASDLRSNPNFIAFLSSDKEEDTLSSLDKIDVTKIYSKGENIIHILAQQSRYNGTKIYDLYNYLSKKHPQHIYAVDNDGNNTAHYAAQAMNVKALKELAAIDSQHSKGPKTFFGVENKKGQDFLSVIPESHKEFVIELLGTEGENPELLIDLKLYNKTTGKISNSLEKICQDSIDNENNKNILELVEQKIAQLNSKKDEKTINSLVTDICSKALETKIEREKILKGCNTIPSLSENDQKSLSETITMLINERLETCSENNHPSFRRKFLEKISEPEWKKAFVEDTADAIRSYTLIGASHESNNNQIVYYPSEEDKFLYGRYSYFELLIDGVLEGYKVTRFNQTQNLSQESAAAVDPANQEDLLNYAIGDQAITQEDTHSDQIANGKNESEKDDYDYTPPAHPRLDSRRDSGSESVFSVTQLSKTVQQTDPKTR